MFLQHVTTVYHLLNSFVAITVWCISRGKNLSRLLILCTLIMVPFGSLQYSLSWYRALREVSLKIMVLAVAVKQ